MRKKSAVTIGKFDGVHLGHQRLMERVQAQKKHGLETVAVIVAPPPGERSVVMPMEQRIRLIKETGIDQVAVLTLDHQLSQMAPGAFAEQILLNRFHAAYVCAGVDFRFGRDRRGDMHCLGQLGLKCGFAVEIVPSLMRDGRKISSSWIRECVEQGDLETAARLLGRPFFLEGVVQPGNGLGHRLGFPTANLIPAPEQILPPRGVCASRAAVDGTAYMAVTNIGRRPTVTEDETVVAESNLFDCGRSLYGKEMKLELLRFIRPEIRFDDRESLARQVRRDIASVKAYGWMRNPL